jgi:hypothetical protein
MEKHSKYLLLRLRVHSIPLALCLVAVSPSPLGLAHLPINNFIERNRFIAGYLGGKLTSLILSDRLDRFLDGTIRATVICQENLTISMDLNIC